MDRLKQAYISNRQKQIAALVAGNEVLFNFYGARVDRAIKALVGLGIKAACLICEWENAAYQSAQVLAEAREELGLEKEFDQVDSLAQR